MKTILGLDLGVASIGWAVVSVEEDGSPAKILGTGCRIVPLSTDDQKEFTSGNAITKNQNRTQRRTARKGYDRYQSRRALLMRQLAELNMLPDDTLKALSPDRLWGLRARSVSESVSLVELGRVLCHLNQKRGYKSSRSEESNENKQQKGYVEAVNGRYAKIKGLDKTIGQYFYDELMKSAVDTDKGKFYTFRMKEEVFPRQAYMDEYDAIMSCQQRQHPDVLTDEVIARLRNEIIYYQRGLKSCKHLVSLCEFEKKAYLNRDGKTVYDGPKVAPKSSPLFQECKIWESVNNLIIKNRKGDELYITSEQKQQLIDHLNTHEKLMLTDLYKILDIRKSDGWQGSRAIGKGLSGNVTRVRLRQALSGSDDADRLLRLDLTKVPTRLVDETTGEVIQVIDPLVEREPLYQLWHTIYSLPDRQELAVALKNRFGIDDDEVISALYKLDFRKDGYGNKSHKVIRRILPYLQEGIQYSDACELAGFSHCDSLTTSQNEARILLDKLLPINKNELRQPVVEKILNQMINLINQLIEEYGRPDEIRVELARELKQSQDERNSTEKNMRERERQNTVFADRITELGVRASRTTIQKYRMWQESEQRCFYCAQPVNVSEFLNGFDVEVEHIIPKSLFFDDSFSNKVCACRKCNAAKGNKTAFDYMRSKADDQFEAYLNRVNDYYKNGKISKTKYDRLLTPVEKIPTDFIDRQLRESQYIARKATELLRSVCRNVYTTSGSVTDFVRHAWGWDTLLHDLNFDRYKSVGKTGWVTFKHKGQEHTCERITDWSKRLDHRHHAIDALVVACTRQGFIQRLSNLNTDRDANFAPVGTQGTIYQDKHQSLEKWMASQPHFSNLELKRAIDRICVSFKAGKKVATPGKRIKYVNGKKTVMQTGILIPRGALSEESVYGKIKRYEKKPLKYLFQNLSFICDERIKNLIEDRLAEWDRDVKKALASLKKMPLYLTEEKTAPLEYGTCYKEEYVLKYPLSSVKVADLPSIIDAKVRERVRTRLEMFGNKEKEAFKDLEHNPLYLDDRQTIKIKTVRLLSGLSAVEPVRYNEAGEPIAFVKPGNNHHVAIYINADGELKEHIVTFWHAVERKKYALPVIIKDPAAVWDTVMELQDRDNRFTESFLEKLPEFRLEFKTSLQQNEMFILGLDEDRFQDAIAASDYELLSKHLYRVQSVSKNDYIFRLHIDTTSDKSPEAQSMKMYYRTQSLPAFISLNPHKVEITLSGKLKLL